MALPSDETMKLFMPGAKTKKPEICGVLSDDGYVRLPLDLLATQPTTHLMSFVDEWEGASMRRDALDSMEVYGHTEWSSQTAPVISMGWDWCARLQSGRIVFSRFGLPKSNLMLTDRMGVDLGKHVTCALLGLAVDQSPWESTVAKAVRLGVVA